MIKINLLEPYKKIYYKRTSDSIKLFSFEGFMFWHLNCKYGNIFLTIISTCIVTFGQLMIKRQFYSMGKLVCSGIFRKAYVSEHTPMITLTVVALATRLLEY